MAGADDIAVQADPMIDTDTATGASLATGATVPVDAGTYAASDGVPSQDRDDSDDDRPGVRPQLLRWPHPTDTAGAYRVPSRLRRLLRARSPRCEWPGCGTRASRCDLDHDRAWPEGPTCACNLGPRCAGATTGARSS